jgi:hypothetical protein
MAKRALPLNEVYWSIYRVNTRTNFRLEISNIIDWR